MSLHGIIEHTFMGTIILTVALVVSMRTAKTFCRKHPTTAVISTILALSAIAATFMGLHYIPGFPKASHYLEHCNWIQPISLGIIGLSGLSLGIVLGISLVKATSPSIKIVP